MKTASEPMSSLNDCIAPLPGQMIVVLVVLPVTWRCGTSRWAVNQYTRGFLCMCFKTDIQKYDGQTKCLVFPWCKTTDRVHHASGNQLCFKAHLRGHGCERLSPCRYCCRKTPLSAGQPNDVGLLEAAEIFLSKKLKAFGQKMDFYPKMSQEVPYFRIFLKWFSRVESRWPTAKSGKGH